MGYDIEDEMEWSEHFYSADHGARGYKAMYFGSDGLRLYTYPYTGEHCHLEIPGTFLEGYSSVLIINYLKSLMKQDYVSRASRIDIAFDNASFTPKMCNEARIRGDIRTKAKKDSWKWYENSQGQTFYLGARSSARMLRIYNRRGPTRLELELKEDWAANFVKVIAEVEFDVWIVQSIGIIRDYVDFVDSESSIKISDALLLEWWESFVNGQEAISIAVSKSSESIQATKLKAWFDRMLFTLYLIRHGLEIDLNEIVDRQKYALTNKHIRKLERLKKSK